MSEGSKEISRRQFMRDGLVTAGGILAALATAGAAPSPVGKENDVAKDDETTRHYTVTAEFGDTITGIIESVQPLNTCPTLAVIYMDREGSDIDTYYLHDKNAFTAYDSLPISDLKAGDMVTFGFQSRVERAITQGQIALPDDTVNISTKIDIMPDGYPQKTIDVTGGRFDRSVVYRLDETTRIWQVSTRSDQWVDASKLKKIMLENPEMKSSEALSRL
jgi:hypothetical protein